MKDIENRQDIELLVNSFYSAVKENSLLRPIFEDVSKIDWDHHLPRMYDFWETILFGKEGFKGNPMLKHILLSRQTEMNREHFSAWLALWQQTIDQHFAGPKATEAKQRAQSIAGLMLHKIQQS